ncbi:electron transfer flavoprotein beta subunit/FixA family protein [Desertihabitans brevis]|uniref:Electron transfer flavoprotein subunit beta n=1 Tax=Desertihabitans brevis TaxID=2268447 RepID=A0A367YZZ9_9ACTN|nr:electron transfer flavoprotein beta subunit/FixA family protein [Desertihabitans brevis]
MKYVPDATGERGFSEDGTVDREGTDGRLSELDEYAVEQSLRLAEASDDEVEVVALTMGPDDAADAIKKALQIGASSGVHVCDDDIAGSDALGTSLVLAAAIRKLEPDLVITGMASTDGVMGVLPAMLSERLGWPGLTLAHTVELDGRTLTVVRDGDTASQRVQAELPAVLSVTDQSGEPRYPGLKNVMAAKKKKVEEWDLDDLGLEADAVGAAAALTTVRETAPRPPRQAGRVVTDSDGSGAAALTEFLTAGKYV